MEDGNEERKMRKRSLLRQYAIIVDTLDMSPSHRLLDIVQELFAILAHLKCRFCKRKVELKIGKD
jgi:hypothetical protein